MIFVNLIYRHFDIFMSQYSQMNKSHAFQGCSKIVFWLHTVRNGNPDTPPRNPSASDFHNFHPGCLWVSGPDTHRHPPDILQAPPETPRHLQGTQNAIRRQQMQTDTPTGVRQTLFDTDRCCLSMSGSVCWCLLSSVNILCSLEMAGRCLGGL